jgi:hypothetical protein
MGDRSRTIIRLVATGALGVGLLGSATPAQAATAKPYDGSTGTVAFSDATTGPAPSTVDAVLDRVKAQLCTTGKVKAHRVSLSKALKRADKFVTHAASKRAVRKMAHSKSTRTGAKAMAVAAAAAAGGHNTAALSALLVAHSRAPKDPAPLIGASVYLTTAGLPNEALALLKQAKKLKAPNNKQAAFGVSQRAALDNNTGYADLLLHNWSGAVKKLTAAVKLAPALAEAQRNLAMAWLCKGDKDKAKQAIFLSVHRQPFRGDLVLGTPYAPTNQLLDLSGGKSVTLPNLKLPATVSVGAATFDDFVAYQGELNTEIGEISAARGTAMAAENAAEFSGRLTPATVTRTRSLLLRAAGGFGSDPDIAALAKKAGTAQSGFDTVQERLESQAGFDCSDPGTSHAQLLGALNAWVKANRDLIQAEYRRITALAAHLHNKAAYDVAIAWARFYVVVGLGVEAGGAVALTTYDKHCAPPTSPVPVDDSDPDFHAPAPCPSGTSGGHFSFKFILVKLALKVDCEQVSLTASTGSPIGIFGRVTKSYRNGTVTFFGGPQAGIGKEAAGWGAKAGVRDGLYITVDSATGKLTDIGMRVEGDAKGGAGKSHSFSAGDGMNFTFVGANPIGSLVGL